MSGEELKQAAVKIINEVRANPEFKIGKLYKVAAIFLAIGEIKKDVSLKVLADYAVSAPNKFRSLLAYRYQIGGTPLEDKFSEVPDNLNLLLEELEKCACALTEETWVDQVLESLDKLEDIFSTMPSTE